jgi:peptidoglycan hydrolase-like protein with peptidoglycan-binding domain
MALVAAVQLALTQLGSPSLTVDGYYGPQTSAAVRRFQTAKGITVDGIPGPETYRTLIDALSELGGAVPAPAYKWTSAWTPGPVNTLSPMYFGTVCSDGWFSSSTGSGTCSWHGGIR